MRWFALLLCCLGFAFAAGCGSVGDPLFPTLNIPTRITDLTVAERGDKLVIHFTIPLRTNEGQVGRPIGNVELRVGPNDRPAFDMNQWASEARRIDVNPVMAPGQIQTLEIPVRDFAGKDIILAVRTSNLKDRYSDWSGPLATISVLDPLPTPAAFKAELVPQGVQLTWAAANVADFRIYRKAPEQGAASLLATATQPKFLDTNAELDKTYEYYVEGFHEKLTSELAGPVTITPKDIFAPSVPAGLTTSSGIGAIDLAWERNAEPRFKEYRLYRSEEGGPFAQIAEGLDIPSFSDHQVQAGKHYRYRLVAVGQNGLASPPSGAVEAIAP